MLHKENSEQRSIPRVCAGWRGAPGEENLPVGICLGAHAGLAKPDLLTNKSEKGKRERNAKK